MTKKILGKIKSKCYKFDLIAEEVNFYTLKVYSTKYLCDTWLIKVEDGIVNLYHNSKKYNNRKCSYHLQNSYSLKKWYWSIQHIDSHNTYVVNRKHYRNTKWVDEVLKRHNERLYVY